MLEKYPANVDVIGCVAITQDRALPSPATPCRASSAVAYAPSKTREPAKSWGLTTLSQGATSSVGSQNSGAGGQSGLSPIFRPVHPALRFHSHRCPIAGQRNTLESTRACENCGLPTLSQGAVNAPENALPFVAAWTERAVPNFSPRPLGPAFSFLSLPDRRAEKPMGTASPLDLPDQFVRRVGQVPDLPSAPSEPRPAGAVSAEHPIPSTSCEVGENSQPGRKPRFNRRYTREVNI